jgi:hypothetical protein
LKISLIIPLHDARRAGWQPLESALRQKSELRDVEVIAVMGRTADGEPSPEADVLALLRRCDAVVHVDADPCRADAEIPLLLAGYGKATGDVLFFMEGHTVLEPDACATIAAYFRDHPQTQIAWAPRHQYGRTPLGALIGIHSKHHESLAAERGGFWLGANSVITRDLFEQLGRLDAAYLRFAERVLCERVQRAGIPIGRLPKALATHHDDISTTQLVAIGAAAGEAKFRYYNVPVSGPASRPDDGPVRVRHGIYHGANRAAIALLLLPLSRILAQCLLRASVRVLGIRNGLAYRLFVLGFGFADLSGFCAARLRSTRVLFVQRHTATHAGPGLAPPRPLGIARTRG